MDKQGAVLPSYQDAVNHICAMIADNLVTPVSMCLVDGAAMRHYIHSRCSEDIEGFFSHRGIVIPPDTTVMYQNGNVNEMLYYDTNGANTLGLMHPDVADDMDALTVMTIGNLTVKVLHPVDIAISKLARYHEKDIEDIQLLIDYGLLDAELFKIRAMESLNYYACRKDGVIITINNVYQSIIYHPHTGLDMS